MVKLYKVYNGTAVSLDDILEKNAFVIGREIVDIDDLERFADEREKEAYDLSYRVSEMIIIGEFYPEIKTLSDYELLADGNHKNSERFEQRTLSLVESIETDFTYYNDQNKPFINYVIDFNNMVVGEQNIINIALNNYGYETNKLN